MCVSKSIVVYRVSLQNNINAWINEQRKKFQSMKQTFGFSDKSDDDFFKFLEEHSVNVRQTKRIKSRNKDFLNELMNYPKRSSSHLKTYK